MSAHAPQNAATFANVLRDGRVVGAWTCLRCRYQIANLRPEDRCPECGEYVAPSLDPTLLRFAPPDALRHVRLGARTVNLSIVSCIVLMPVLVFAINTLGVPWASQAPDSFWRDLLTGPLPPFSLIYIMLLWFVYGVFLMTTRLSHHVALPRSASQLRWTLRVFALLIPALFAPIAYAIVLDSVGAPTFLDDVPDAVPISIASTMVATGVALLLGLSLYAWSIGAQTYLRGRPLRSFARAPSWFAILAASMSLFVFGLAEPIQVAMDAPIWGVLQWLFVSASIAMGVFIALAMLSSLLVVDALRCAVKRDEREARSAPKREEGDTP